MQVKSFKLLTAFTLLVVVAQVSAASAYNCGTAASAYCGTGICANYQFVNSACTLQVQTTCGSNQIFSNSSNACISCLPLSSALCTSTCSNYFYFASSTNMTSGNSSITVSGCSSCQLAYGLGCLTCDSSSCLTCNSTMTINQRVCIDKTCNLAYCAICLSASTCQLCQPGYHINAATSTCEISSCLITYCTACNGVNCATCFTGYVLSSSKTAC